MASLLASHTAAVPPPVRTVLRRAQRITLRWRLTLSFGLLFAIVMLAVFLTLHRLLVGTLLSDVDSELRDLAVGIAAETSNPPVFASDDQLRELVRKGGPAGSVSYPSLVIIRDVRGRIRATSTDTRPDSQIGTRVHSLTIQHGTATARTMKTSTGRRVRAVGAPIWIDGQIVGTVQTGETVEGVYSAGDRLQALLVIEGAAGLLLASAAGYVFVRRQMKPLEGVVQVAADIEAHDLTRRLGLRDVPAEVQQLADTFDAMLQRLEGAFEQQRSFVLDVSHELRTPLTALRGNIDVLLLDPSLAPDLRVQLQRMSAETGRLIRLAANLLSLAKLDAGSRPVLAPVELDLLCLEVVQQTMSLKPGVRVRLGREDQLLVEGDRDLLKQLLLNLVENGVAYTPTGGQVTVSLFRDGGAAALEVQDTGVGIRPDDLPHIFERGYRAADSRRRAAGGAGVGLSIVAWVACLHGSAVQVASVPDEGSTFTVRLPLLDPNAPDPDDPPELDLEHASNVPAVPVVGRG